MRGIAAALACLMATAPGLFIYYGALFIHISSTSALVFIFIPLYQLLAAIIATVFAIERRTCATRNRLTSMTALPRNTL